MTHAELPAFGSLWYRTALRATFANKKEDPHVNAFRDACAVKIFLVAARFNALVWKYLRRSDYCRVRRLNGCAKTLCFVSLSFVPFVCVVTYLFFIASLMPVDMKCCYEIKYVDTNSATIKFMRISLPASCMGHRCPANRFDHNSGNVTDGPCRYTPLFTHFR